tara:strand:+ start:1182 stop:3170 length:1989 start_codon:yes stop_codon:yes gene_type:complete
MAEAIFSGDRTIKLVKQLIRYDIPFLLLGKSSIGKSYSVIEMTERWRMPKSLLYIGSEKPSNIEGLPRLTGTRAGGDTLEFYKPNWFPSVFLIESYVKNGKKIFDKYVEDHFDGDKAGCITGENFQALNSIFEGLFIWEWDSNVTTKQEMKISDVNDGKLSTSYLNKKGMKVERQLYSDAELFKMQESGDVVVRDDVRDLCLYLSTLLGYGNFWLILDELDKVDESEQDKYAPLLHIVRERIIKDYSMRTLNEGKGAGVPKKVKAGSNYDVVKAQLDEAIELNMPLLDTRIIGIANATEDIEDALFRRFCHIIIEEIMMVSAPPTELEGMRMCLNEVTKDSQAGALTDDLEFKLLNEVNLQWQFGFLPTMLNTRDAGNNYIYEDFMKTFGEYGFSKGTQNAIIAGKKSSQQELYDQTKTTALFKVIRNNFGVDNEMDGGDSVRLQQGIYKCLASAILGGSGTFSMETAGGETPSMSTTKVSAMKQMIQDALDASDGNAAEAANMLLLNMKIESRKVSNNAEAVAWMGKLLGLVEESEGTSVREEIVGNFYPEAIEFIARHKAPSDEKDQLIRFVNAFIELNIQEDQLSDETAAVDIKALEKLSVMNALNALQLKQIKLVATLRAMQEAGQQGAVRKLVDILSKGKTGDVKAKLDKLVEVYGK